MSTRNLQVCCCKASTWTAVIGWIHIVGSALATLAYLVAIFALGSDEAKGLGILLVIGNKREYVTMLWIWVIPSCITYGLTLLLGIFAVTRGNWAQSSSQFFSAAIMGFFIYCVHRRIKDIRQNQQAVGYNTAKLEAV